MKNTLKLKRLTLEDKLTIEAFTEKFLPFSDFNFLSLFSYNTNESVEFGFYNENLVIKFEDYLTNENFYSFLGTNKVVQTTSDLIDISIQKNLKDELGLVPESVLEAAPDILHTFEVTEDRDNFDYIVSCEDVAYLSNEKYPKKRKLVDDFLETYPGHTIKMLDLNDTEDQEAILKTFHTWSQKSHRNEQDVMVEYTAIKRLLDNAQGFSQLYGLGVYHNQEIIAFNTFETTASNYGVSSFQKAHKDYAGLYAFLTHQMAMHLHSLGCQYINFEQDLGIEGLRSSKLSWHPVHHLKKYTVKAKS